MAGTFGTAVPGYETRVESAPGLEAPAGGTGRLLVRGPTCCTYWRRPDLQCSAVRDGWHVTGDLVRRDADGAIRFDRRADDLIVSAGYNVSAAEIERVLAAHPDVLEARVTGVPDPVRGQVVKASVVLAPHAEKQGPIARLQERARREPAPYKGPREVESANEAMGQWALITRRWVSANAYRRSFHHGVSRLPTARSIIRRM